MTGAYAFSKTLDSFSGAGNIFNRGTFKSLSPNDRPNVLSFSISYTTPVSASSKAIGWPATS